MKSNLAVGEQINLAEEFNKRLQSGVLQSEMGLDASATATGQAVRWDEFSKRHNNDGSHKPLIQSEMGLDVMATANGQAVRHEEFSVKHNNDGSFKAGIIQDADINSNAGIQATKLAIQKNYKKSSLASPSATANTDGSVISLVPPSGYAAINPMAISIVFGGTFVGSESITAKVVATYSDNTSATVTKTSTAIEAIPFSNSDLMDLIKDDVYIKQLDVKSQSNTANSAVTVTFNHCGFYL